MNNIRVILVFLVCLISGGYAFAGSVGGPKQASVTPATAEVAGGEDVRVADVVEAVVERI